MFHSLLVRLAAAALCLFAASASAQEGERSYILTTATTGGTYYPVGVAIATLTKVRLEPTTGVSLSAISSAGSGENVRLLRDDEAQFAILQGLYGAWAWTGEGPLAEEGPQTNLRAITMLWPNVEQFVIRTRFAEAGTMADMTTLRGRRFSIGARNSGTEGSGRHILGALGFDPDTDFDLVYQGYGPSADSLQNGVIDGMNAPAGIPVAALTRAFAADGETLTILSFTDEEIEAVNARYPLWTRFDIPAGTYPGQSEVIRTVAQPNFLAVRADIDDEAVYLITKAIYENLPFLAGIHSATSYMALDRAVAGLPLPLHPGALRYYEEAGVEIPDRLRPPQ
jgi:TRAP transporter TAXI family solute receptor